jgi:acetolactate synthase I/II/III large subunit
MNQKKTWRGGELVLWGLKQEGVDCLFGLSGGHIAGIFDASIDCGMRLIDTRHEQAAVNMAEGWARFTGKPGVAVVTAGPGVVNAFPGVAVAMQSGSPLVVIAGRSSLERRDLGAMQDMDQVEIMRPVTKWARSVYQTSRISEYISTAFRQAVSGRPGPVFLEIPVDVMDGEAEEENVSWPQDYRTKYRPSANPDAVSMAADLLKNAKRPLVVAGGGTWWSGAVKELRSFVEATGIPVYTRSAARGVIPDDHPLCGGFFPAGLMQADVALIVGTRLDWTIGYGRPPLFNPDLKVIQIDIAHEEIGKNRRVDVGITGDALSVLKDLGEALGGKCQVANEWVTTVKSMMAVVRMQFSSNLREGAQFIHPVSLCQELRRLLPRDAIVAVDGGDIAVFANMVMDALGPGSLMWVGGFGHLGVGIPYGIAAKLAHPEKNVVVLSGDGSVGFSFMEFDTAIRHKVPFVTVVSNDAGWGQIRRGQIKKYGKDRVVGSNLSSRPYHEAVKAMGGHGEAVERLEHLQGALDRAFASNLPACINVTIDPEFNFTGMDFPWPIT